MRCEGAVALAGLGGAPRPLVARHVASCLRCQAEQGRRARLQRLLAQLRTGQAALPAGVLSNVLDAIGAAAEAERVADGTGRAWRATLAGGALGSAVIVLALRSRLPRRGAPARQCYR